MSDYNLIRLDSSNFADLLGLMEVVNGSTPDGHQLRKKYDTRAFGAENLGYLAYKQGEKIAAAYYGVFPMRVMLAGKEVLAAQSGDTMTHPDHRGKGLFIALARKTYALAAEEGVKFVFGFPNSNSYPGFVKKLAWQHPYNMVAVNIVVPTLPVNLLAKRLPVLARLQKKWLTTLLDMFFVKAGELPLPCSSVTGSGSAGVVRDRAFWDYKRDCCEAYQVGQTILFLKYDGDISIGDAVAANGEIGPAISKLRFVAALAGILRIKTYCSPGSQLARNLGSKGHTRESLAYGYVAFEEGMPLEQLQFTYADYDTF
ncbi:GNAT family N-acetyltransferase [Herbaspirillum sp. alder98]|uniref:GNAT family N-acetyltransferase n=1 Tax=Herbaspirillum sp. alder98 TaxID=2913096 RepID=UPI001CD8BE66|nr:GNAT family N-acetyltransferase [Herbaspirillum sp. alder98]MCA1324321.1 GNAT family N-acetyltransferase [Herbaspirillum sp. alder98]